MLCRRLLQATLQAHLQEVGPMQIPAKVIMSMIRPVDERIKDPQSYMVCGSIFILSPTTPWLVRVEVLPYDRGDPAVSYK